LKNRIFARVRHCKGGKGRNDQGRWSQDRGRQTGTFAKGKLPTLECKSRGSKGERLRKGVCFLVDKIGKPTGIKSGTKMMEKGPRKGLSASGRVFDLNKRFTLVSTRKGKGFEEQSKGLERKNSEKRGINSQNGDLRRKNATRIKREEEKR